MHLPTVHHVEPLINQANAFLDCILEGAPCRSGPTEATAIVSVLEAATESAQLGGRMCPVAPCGIGTTIARQTKPATSIPTRAVSTTKTAPADALGGVGV